MLTSRVARCRRRRVYKGAMASKSRASESRFIKSYKYKHKRKQPATEKPISCDGGQLLGGFRRMSSRTRHVSPMRILTSLAILIAFQGIRRGLAFCPFKCLCNDQSLSTICTRVPSLSIVPMTLNPLLKQLTLQHLPISELSNSLSVYRQLEYLNLNSNLLRQIKYQNFNFKSAPASLLLGAHSSSSSLQTSGKGNKEFDLNQSEQVARNLKQSIDKISSNQFGTSNEDEIRFHLRELYLSDNRIELLGGQSDESELKESFTNEKGDHQNRRIKSDELERLAPFLTLTRLELLDLSGNRLTRIQQHAFLGLIHLKRLDLSRNNLDSIHEFAFVGLIGLEILKLNNNRLAAHLHQLSNAFCRAPMIQLQFLDLSDNLKIQLDSDLVLPNQMFICTPRLTSLQLNALQLRYIQVNAFDNLQQLETLNLSRNHLEQVPSDSLSYSNSNLSSSLKQLDLSDTLIEFVSANSLSSLKNLQKLQMNQMQRLVSFDLASLSFRLNDLQSNGQDELRNAEHEQMAKQMEQELLSSELHHLPRLQLFERTMEMRNHRQDHQVSLAKTINHQRDKHQVFLNDQLIELQLRHNLRLQSLHCSLAVRNEPPRGRIKFSRLKMLDLSGASELRELPLEQMMYLEQGKDNLQVDLSFASNLNCSSCQMGWLVEAAKKQRRLNQLASWTPIQFDPSENAPSRRPSSAIVLLGSEAIGCSWPFVLPLNQLVELETSYAPLFDQCNQQSSADSAVAPLGGPPVGPGDVQRSNYSNNKRHHELASSDSLDDAGRGQHDSLGSLAFGLILVLLLLSLSAKVALTLLSRRRRKFKWRSPSSVTTSIGSPTCSQNNTHSPADCSSSSILSCPAAAAAAATAATAVTAAYVGRPELDCCSGNGDSPQANIGPAASRLRAASREGNQDFNRRQLQLSQRRLHSNGFTNNVGQIERVQRRANLFSRIAGRWSGNSSRRAHQLLGPSFAPASGAAPNHPAAGSAIGTHIGDKVVYGGGLEIFAAAAGHSARLQDGARPTGLGSAGDGGLGLLSGVRLVGGQVGNFIRPLSERFSEHSSPPIGSSPVAHLAGELVCATDCLQQQQHLGPELGAKSGRNCDGQTMGSNEMLLKSLGSSSTGAETSQPATCQWRQQASTLQQDGREPGRPGQLSSASYLAGDGRLSPSAITARPAALLPLPPPPPPPPSEPQTHSEEALLLDGHIYVTLDRPIRGQNGCDEYKLYGRPQEQWQRQRQRQEQREQQLEQHAAANQHCKAAPLGQADHKSFGLPSKRRPESQVYSNRPLRVVGGEFKLDQSAGQVNGRQGERPFACEPGQWKRQWAACGSTGKLSSPLEQADQSGFEGHRFEGLGGPELGGSLSGRKQQGLGGQEKNGGANLPATAAAYKGGTAPATADNVTGQTDCGQHNGMAKELAGPKVRPSKRLRQQGRRQQQQQQLFSAPPGSLNDGDGTNETGAQTSLVMVGDVTGSAAGKYDANKASLSGDLLPVAAETTSNEMGPCKDDYAINGLSQNGSNNGTGAAPNLGQELPLAPNEKGRQQQQRHRQQRHQDGQLPVGVFGATGSRNNHPAKADSAPFAASSIMIGQRNFLIGHQKGPNGSGGGGGSKDGDSYPFDGCGSVRANEIVFVGQDSQRFGQASATGQLSPASVIGNEGLRHSRPESSDILPLGRQSDGKGVASAATNAISTPSMVGAESSKVADYKVSRAGGLGEGNGFGHGGHEIYSNQYYYCKPSTTATSQRRRDKDHCPDSNSHSSN